MLYIGIDIASKKHDCCVIGENGKILVANFTFENNHAGYDLFLQTIRIHCGGKDFKDVKIGLESTGHYSNNLISFLQSKELNITVFNPLQVNLYRKAQSLRKTKTDKADAKFLATMLISSDLKSYAPTTHQISELKALVRHRFRLIALRSKLKVSVSRLVTILFPELLEAVGSIHQASSYAMLLEYPTVKAISACHLTKLTNLLFDSSKHRYDREKAVEIKALASTSIGSDSAAVGFELQQTIRLINNLQQELTILDKQIKKLMIELNSPILTIPGISYILGSIIIAEIGNIENFDNPNKLLAFAGLDPSTYQSGNFTANITPMVKRGSSYLRWALLQAARLVAQNDSGFKAYSDKKRSEGKHYFVVLSHVGKKLVRIVFHLLKNNTGFVSQG